MIVVGMVKRGTLAVVAVMLLMGTAGVSSASALSPWWHLTSGSRPGNLHAGNASNEVQELVVKATAGKLALVDSATESFEFFEWNVTSGELQKGLENLYGKGDVEVSNGPGGGAGTKTYSITFIGKLADQMVPSMQVYEFLEGAGHEATLVAKAKGRPDGQILVTASNLGDAPAAGGTPARITDTLPAGLKAVSITGRPSNTNSPVPLVCSLESLSCAVTETVPSYGQVEIEVGVVVREGASASDINEVSATGGGARGTAIRRTVSIDSEPTAFGLGNFEMMLEEEDGSEDTQAGSHPFQLVTTIALNQTGSAEDPKLVAPTKDLNFALPPGLVGNPTPLAQCTMAQFLKTINYANECPPQTAIGVATVTVKDAAVGKVTFPAPLFNLEPAVGEPARFGFYIVIAGAPIILETSVRTGKNYGITVSVNNITEVAEFLGSQVTFWGVPGDSRHDNARGWGCVETLFYGGSNEFPCHPLEAHYPPPFLSLPTSCDGPLQNSVEADSWTQPGVFPSFPSYPMPSMDGCNRVPFSPSVKVTPDGQAGSTPTGLTVDEHVSQLSTLATSGLAESDVKGLSVTLPEGIALNPAGADGLLACSEEQIGLQNTAAQNCPDASKVGNVKIKTPLLPNPLEGAAYLATQNQNPFGSLVALYIYAEDPISGVRVKAAGEVQENPTTGQLTAHFEQDPGIEGGAPAGQFLPQLPFEDVELHFFGGDRAPLVTPALCGSYRTTGTFTPWSGNPTTESSSEFQVTSGPNGKPCFDPLPFSPSLTAGTTSIQAGGFSPFTMTMSRPDGSQNLQAIQLHTPRGLLGTLSTVKLCGETQANTGTCGSESLIGHTIVSVGVGGDPYSVTGGEVFITGPYKDAPYGLSIVNPAKAGPFDLGKVIVRAKVEVDPLTAALTITTDDSGPYKIPTILDGIPLQIQHVNVSIDRPGFTFNPTNCSPLAITGSLTSDQGAVKGLSVPFQITNCAVLAFKPKLTAKTSGKTSRASGASLSVKLTYPAGPYDANISKVKVDLPKQLPSRLTTLQKACTAATFEANPANCPAASIVGHATATTPVMPVPLTGPAYFVSHGGEAFPSLIIVLQGYGATVHLIGTTFIDKAGITSSTFKTVPDVPVGTFELTLPQGKYSALAANGNLCTTKKLAMPTSFVAQNGAVLHSSTPIVPTGCAKKKAHRTKRHKGNTHRKK